MTSHNPGSAIRRNYHALVRADVLDLVPKNAGAVLDVGGGVGGSAAHLKSLGRASKAVVVDLVADSHLPEIDDAYSGSLENSALLTRIRADHGTFDTILCLDILEHLSEPWSVVDGLVAMLAPGGVIVASIPNVRNYRLLVPLVFRNRFDLAESGILDRTHLRWFVRDTAIGLFSGAGLDIEQVTEHFTGRRKRLFNVLTVGLFKSFLVIQFFIRARRPS